MIGPLLQTVSRKRLENDGADALDADETRSRSETADAADGASNGPGRGPNGSSRRRWPWLLAALAIGAVYHVRVRPWHRTWGTTPREAVGALPGDEFVQESANQVTHAIEIDAPPGAVWRWLVQIGQNRGGFYSNDFLENLVGADIHTVDRIVPAYQDLSEGDTVRLAPEDYPIETLESAPEVVRLEPERAIVLRPPVDGPTWTWAFVLREPDEGTTRLVARMRSPAPSSRIEAAIGYLVWEPAHFVMERRMLRELERRATGRADEVPIAVE